MSQALRRYRERRGGPRFPLLELFEAVGEDPTVTRDPEALARRTGLPPAALRGVLSYYADLREPPPPVQVCRGTSCTLNGGRELENALRAEGPCGTVHCLGYCDRSPAALRNGDELHVASGSSGASGASGASGVSARQPPPPSIRCLASEPIVTRRVGRGDFSDLARAREDGAYRALERALARRPVDGIEALEASGERGRGGAGFPTGTKWRRCAEAPGETRYVVANGDEGDPGSYVDRVLMEQDPHGVLEGLALCAYAVGAREGIVFVRSEYPWARRVLQRAIDDARAAGILGSSVLGSDFAFDVVLFRGLGSYVCGEETAMLNAIEGLRGEVRLRPPYPAVEGLFGCPTVVQNVETLANVPYVLEHGPEAYAALGTQRSSGTKALCLNRGFERPGIVEVEFGLPLREVVEEAGGGREGRAIEAVVLGGPMGSLLGPDEWDVPLCYGAMAERDVQLGHGGIVAIPEDARWPALVEHWLEFLDAESCGKCVPCSLGSRRALELVRSTGDADARPRLESVLELMQRTSLCAFGRLLPVPVRRLLDRYGDRVFDGEAKP